MSTKKTELMGLDKSELEEFAVSAGEKKFHGRQIYTWIYQKRVSDFNLMTDLSKSLRAKLTEIAGISLPQVSDSQMSEDGFTRKLRLELDDSQSIESVLMKNKERITLCVSTQIGCALGCSFCATGTMGFRRNLTAGEIVGQYLTVQNLIDSHITNVVLMGMGEPLLNYNNVSKAVKIFTDPDGMLVSRRKLTLSTAGIIPGIERLTRDRLPVKLAVSLNAVDDISRSAIMPVNKKYPLSDLFTALHKYEKSTRHRITFEYVVIKGVNDTLADAKKLIKLLGGFSAKLNLIAFNPVDISGSSNSIIGGAPPDTDSLKLFSEYLERPGLNVIIRKSQGGDISAACGQLCV